MPEKDKAHFISLDIHRHTMIFKRPATTLITFRHQFGHL